MFRVNIKKIPECCHRRSSDVFIVNFIVNFNLNFSFVDFKQLIICLEIYNQTPIGIWCC